MEYEDQISIHKLNYREIELKLQDSQRNNEIEKIKKECEDRLQQAKADV